MGHKKKALLFSSVFLLLPLLTVAMLPSALIEFVEGVSEGKVFTSNGAILLFGYYIIPITIFFVSYWLITFIFTQASKKKQISLYLTSIFLLPSAFVTKVVYEAFTTPAPEGDLHSGFALLLLIPTLAFVTILFLAYFIIIFITTYKLLKNKD